MTDDVLPDFYMSSCEYEDFAAARRCYRLKRLVGPHRDDYLAIRVDPPVPGDPLGYPNRQFEGLVIATRFRGDSLFPLAQWPTAVHVFLPLEDNMLESGKVRIEDLDHVAWAELYATEEDAKKRKPWE
jgi:hypothetical protein